MNSGPPAVAGNSGGWSRPGLSRRSVISAGIFGTVAAVAAGCDRSSGATPAAALPTGADLVVGVCLELTGSGSTVGMAQQKALTIEQTKLNNTGVVVADRTRRIRMIIKDNMSDPKTAAAITNDLISNQSVVAIIGGATAATSRIMAPLAESAKIPMLSTAAADAIVRPVTSRRFIFKLGPDATDVATKLTDRLKTLKITRIAIVAEAGDHGDSGIAAMMTTAHTSGAEVVAVSRVPIAAKDYAKQAHQIAATNPAVVVIWAVAPTSGRVAVALRAAGYRGLLMFDSGAASEDSLSAANRTASMGAYLVSPAIMAGRPIAVTTPAEMDQVDFFEQYTSVYGAFSGLAVYGADALILVSEAATRAQSTNRLRVRDELEAVPYDGLAGEYIFSTISHGGVAADALSLFQLRKSDWVKLD